MKRANGLLSEHGLNLRHKYLVGRYETMVLVKHAYWSLLACVCACHVCTGTYKQTVSKKCNVCVCVCTYPYPRVPVRDPSKLVGAKVHIHVDTASNREVALILKDDALRDALMKRAPAPISPVAAANLSDTMINALAKTIGQDVETARYYMQENGGCIRRAHAAFMSDKEWAERNPVLAAKRGRGGGGGGGFKLKAQVRC